MPLIRYRGDEPGPGVPEDAAPKEGAALFFDILYRDFFNLVKLSLLLTLFCLPIITIPPAITAASKIAFKMSRYEHFFLWQDFWETFKKEFTRSLGLGWLLIAGIILTITSSYFSVLQVKTNSFLYIPLVISSISAALLMMTGFYLFPMISSIDISLKSVLKNAVLLALLHQPYNLLTMLIIAGLSYLILYLFPFSAITLPLFFFGFFCFLMTFCAASGIKKYVLKEELETKAL